MMRARHFVLSIALVALGTLAHGYRVHPQASRWARTVVVFDNNLDTVEAHMAGARAVQNWRDVLADALDVRTLAGQGNPAIGNNRSEIGFETLPPEVVSLTRVVSRSGRILEADVSIGSGHAGPSPWTVGAALNHEVGHALGLDHTDEGGVTIRAAMSADPGSTTEGLTRDDLSGVNAAYRPNDPFATVPPTLTPLDVTFPPRNEPFAFRQQLETTYRDVLRRSALTSFVDIEGTIVWTQEYLRYRVNGCSHTDATNRVVTQILGGGIQPVCVDFSGTTVNFPPRNEPLAFRQTLETVYRDSLRRNAVQTFVDAEGDIVWTQEYFRYRVNGCSNQQATDRVLAQVNGGPVQPECTGGAVIPVTNFISSISSGPTTATLRSGRRPDAAAGPPVDTSSTLDVVNGGARQVTLTTATPVDTVIISLDTGTTSVGRNRPTVLADSYYELRLPSPQTVIDLTLVLPVQVASQRFTLEYAVALSGGPLGSYRAQTIQVISVGTGDVQISVSWNSSADIDLHVVEPNGNEIYWANDVSSTGGELDLDSNAGCGSDGPRVENIRWPAGLAPSGPYIVRVDHWSNCGAASTNYVVRVINGQSSQTFTGTFTGEGTFGGLGSGVTVTTFTR